MFTQNEINALIAEPKTITSPPKTKLTEQRGQRRNGFKRIYINLLFVL